MERDDVKEIIRLYVSEGWSARKIGNVFNASHTKIYRILDSNGVDRRSHSDAAEGQRKYVSCVICGKVFNPKKNRTRKTCSDECHSKLMSEIQRGERGPNWIHGKSQSAYTTACRSIKRNRCDWCGSNTKRLDIHHKDRDKSNNSPDNIMTLCVSCHANLHYREDDRGLRGWKPPVGE